MSGLFGGIFDKIREWFLGEEVSAKVRHEQIRASAAEVVEGTGLADYCKRTLDAKDDNERTQIRAEWEKRMAEREKRRTKSPFR